MSLEGIRYIDKDYVTKVRGEQRLVDWPVGYVRTEQISNDGDIRRKYKAETMNLRTDPIEDKFEKNYSGKDFNYTDTYEIERDGRFIGRKTVSHTCGYEHTIEKNDGTNKWKKSARLDEKGNRISNWILDYYDGKGTHINPYAETIRGLPRKISDLPKQVQKAYVEFFEKCENLLNEYRKEQGML